MSVYAPPPSIQRQLPVALFVHAVIRMAREVHAPILISSWWRSQEHNRRVGGHPYSQHLVGLAMDVLSDDLEEVVAAARRQGITALPGRRYVHLQWLPSGTVRHLIQTGIVRL